MKAREAKKWLRAIPTSRQAFRYDQERDIVVTLFVPRLAGSDVSLPGNPLTYTCNDEAIAAAMRFQDAIRSNHPQAVSGGQDAAGT